MLTATDAARQLQARLETLPYFRIHSAPKLSEYNWYNPFDRTQADTLLAQYNLRVDAFKMNAVLVHKDARPAREVTPVNLHGHFNTVMMDRDSGLHGKIHITNDNNLAVFLGEQGYLAIDVQMYGGDTFVWGRQSVSWGMRVWVQGGTACTIGEGCLFSENTTIRTTDHHTMFDLKTLTAINTPQDVIIGRHVWVGQDCAISKGVCIGDGSIIGARSFLNRNVGMAELWAGSPARMLRDQVSWVVSHPGIDIDERDKVIALLQNEVHHVD